MSNPSNTLRTKRTDLSPYLFHYTKGEFPAKTLATIINEQQLKSPRGFICFTEAPLTSSFQQIEYMSNFKKPMYSSFGIGFSRDLLIRNGAMPVIYGTKEDETFIHENLKWRFEELNIITHDYSWLREWRINGVFDFSQLDKNEIIIIAPTKEALNELIGEDDFDVDFAYEHEIRSAIPYLYSYKSRLWKGFAIEDIKQEIRDDYQLSGATLTQEFGEELD